MTPRLTRADLSRAVARHRALLAGGLAAGAVASGLGVLAPEPAAGILVLRAVRDLPAGTSLTAADVSASRVPSATVPAGVLADPSAVLGRLLSGPVRAGELLTDVRLAGAALLRDAPVGQVAVPVRLADAASAALLHAGDRIDVLAAATTGGQPGAAVVALDAEVLAVPTAVGDAGEGALVLLSETPEIAARLAAAAVTSRLSFTLRAAA